MPVVLRPEQYTPWMDPTQTAAKEVARVIAEAQSDFVHYPGQYAGEQLAQRIGGTRRAD
jgi:putative SOS response-associated peptidase YedK